MQLLKSLLCRQGRDSKFRFLIISLVSFLFIVFLRESVDTAGVFTFVIAFVLTIITFLSSIRRCKDGNATVNLAYITALVFLLANITLLLTDSNWFYVLFLFPTTASFLLTTYPETKDKKVMGYEGPVDLSDILNKSHSSQPRIEPSFATSSIPDNATTTQRIKSNNENIKASVPNDFLNNINQAIDSIFPLTKQKLTILLTCLSLLIIAFIWSNVQKQDLSNSKVTDPKELADNTNEQMVDELNFVEMADNFSLYSTNDENIVIKWQADSTNQVNVWSQKTARGDKACTSIIFNNGEKIRTIEVIVKDIDTYHAIFSPLDQQKLLTNMAKRSKFTLCGYNFSLKGSQATLNKNVYYRDRL